MNYTALLKKSYKIVIKNKFLWLFGFLLGGAGAGFGNWGGGGGSGYNGNSTQDTQAFSQIGNFISQYWMLILVLGLIILLIIIIFAILSIIARGALIGSVKKITNKEETGVRDGFGIGWHKFWRILGIGIVLFLMISIPLLSMSLIIFLLYHFFSYAGLVVGIIFGFFFLIILILFSIILKLIAEMAYCYCIIDGKRIMESLRQSWFLFKSRWKNISIVFLLLFLINMVKGIALVFASLIVGIPLFLIGIGVYYGLGLVATIVYAILFGLLILAGSAIFSGAVNSYYQTAWTLTFLNLAKGVPIEE